MFDLMMPRLSGYAVLQRMRDSETGASVILANISEAEAPASLDSPDFARNIIKVNLAHNQLAKIVDEVLGDTAAVSSQ